MVKYYSVYFYIPNQRYVEVYKCLDRQKAFEYAAREYKRFPKIANVRYVVYSEWLLTDGVAKGKCEWEFTWNKETQAIEQGDWRE